MIDQLNVSNFTQYNTIINQKIQQRQNWIIIIKTKITRGMFSNIIRMAFSYTERALTPKNFSNMIQSSITKKSFPEVMHNLYLYQNNVNVFDYDYFQKICYFLLDYQKKMTTFQIMTVLRLGRNHNVKNQMIWRHFEAELHQRLNQSIMPLIQNEQKQIQDKFNSIFKKLQQSSNDQFQILTPEFKQDQLKSEQHEQIEGKKQIQVNKQPEVNTKQLATKLRKDDVSNFSYDLVQILIWYGCENSRFINLLLQTQLYPNIIQKTPYSSIRFTELLVYACQLNMRNYEQNKKNYTARSIKKIYKFQSFYFIELEKLLKETLSQYSAQQLKYITDVIRSFPIKKRQHRRNIVGLISNEWKTRNIQIQQGQKQKLIQILRKDQKLILKFRKSLQKIQQKTQQSVLPEQRDQAQKINE